MLADQSKSSMFGCCVARSIFVFAVMVVAGLTSGCTPGSILETRQLDRDDTDFLSLPVGRRVAIAQGRETNEFICLVPSPDYAQATGFALARPGVGAGESSSDLALGGRSSNVLIAREVLYMTCSMIARHARSSHEAKEIFYKGISAVTDIADNDTLQGTGIGTNTASAQITEPSTGVSDTEQSRNSSTSETDSSGGW